VLYGNCNDGKIKKYDFDDAPSGWVTVCDWSALSKPSGGNAYTNIYGWQYGTTKLTGLFGQRMYETQAVVEARGVTWYDAVQCDVADGAEYDVDLSPTYFCNTACCFGSDCANGTTCVSETPCAVGAYHSGNIVFGKNGHWGYPHDSALYVATYGGGVGMNGVHHGAATDGDKCVGTHWTDDENPFYTEGEGLVQGGHVNWLSDADWYITDLFPATGGNTPGISTKIGAAQYYFNRGTMTFTETPRRFLTQSSAIAWIDNVTDPANPYQVNYSAIALPSVGIGKNSLAFTATNGKYSYEDYKRKSWNETYSDYEPISMWIAKISIGAPLKPTNFQRAE
jgi:hypothetical protein